MSKLYITIITVIFSNVLLAQGFSGKVIDGATSAPLEFANAVLLRNADSVLVAGTVTDSLGNFSIQVKEGDYLLKISFLGYQTQIINVQNANAGTIVLLPDENTLREVTVTGIRPIIKMEDGGISTDIQHSMLKSAGTAADVLEQLPFVNREKDNITVFGKGTPLIYLDNKLIRSNSELEQINSDRIKKVTVITTPGAEYDATVQSVIRIETKNTQGDGLSGNLLARAKIDKKFSHTERTVLNFRHKKLDIFGMLLFGELNDLVMMEMGHTTRRQGIVTDIAENGRHDYKRKSIETNIGANYTPNKNHSIGIKYDYRTNLVNNSALRSNFEAVKNNITVETFTSETYYNAKPGPVNYWNAYYNGNLNDRLSLKLDVDFANGKSYATSEVYNFRTDSTETVSNEQPADYSFFASKLILTSPILSGNITYGGEFVKTESNQQFKVLRKGEAHFLESSQNTSNQLLNALFFTYSKQIKPFSMNVALRYENVNFEYFNNGVKEDEPSKTYNNWLPSAAVSYERDNLQMQLNYRNSTQRPSYYQLRSEVQYNSPYMYEGGNPYLKPTVINTLSYLLVWKNLQASVSYDMNKNMNALVPSLISEDVIFLQPVNYPKSQNLYAMAAYSPTINIWNPSLELDFSKNFYKFGDPVQTYNKPVLFITLKNSFSLPEDLAIIAECTYNTRGNEDIINYTYDFFRANIYISKLFFDKKLRINIGAGNIFNTDKQRKIIEINGIYHHIFKDLNTQNVNISISYNFNATGSKYKGERASDEINRL